MNILNLLFSLYKLLIAKLFKFALSGSLFRWADLAKMELADERW